LKIPWPTHTHHYEPFTGWVRPDQAIPRHVPRGLEYILDLRLTDIQEKANGSPQFGKPTGHSLSD